MTARMSIRLVCIASLLVAACLAEPAPGVRRSAIVDGQLAPDDLGVPIGAAQRNAVLGQLVTFGGDQYQGCTGTLIGDRAVLAAAHCVVLNQDDWLAGADPEVVDPAILHYAVGDDVEDPLCLLQAEEVHLNPDVHVTRYGIEHDLSLTILTESALDSCPDVLPIPVNRVPETEDLVGVQMLEGGFGSTDGTYDFSPIRHWALVELGQYDGFYLLMRDVELGFPTFGDSGGGALYRPTDGRLRVYGVVSAGNEHEMLFIQLSSEAAFFDSLLDPTIECGDIDEIGTCMGDAAVRCDDAGFLVTDCAETGAGCVEDEAGGAICACGCDVEDYCEPDCACDDECPCACDATEGCDDGCACDAACHVEREPDAGAAELDAGPSGEPDAGDEGGSDDGGCAAAGRPRVDRSSLFVIAVVLCLLSRRRRADS